MRIAYISKATNLSEKSKYAIDRRRLFALIDYWVKDGCSVTQWKKGIDCDLIYIVNLPASLEETKEVFANKAKHQSVVVGMIEDFDTSVWADINNENIDDICELIKTNNTNHKTVKGRLKKIKNWLNHVGIIETPQSKIKKYITNSDGVICTSELQAASLRRYNPYVSGIADCIPEDDYKIHESSYLENLLAHKNNRIILVWEGTEWGLQLLELIRKPINNIVKKMDVQICLRLIMPRYRPPLFNETDNKLIAEKRFLCEVELYEWNQNTVGALISSSDIGLAPQPINNPFYKAKAYSKPLVYMVMGLPVIASKIPSYCELIQNNINGFIAETDHDWETFLYYLIKDNKLRTNIGLAAKKRVNDFHSVEKVANEIKGVFKYAVIIHKNSNANKN